MFRRNQQPQDEPERGPLGRYRAMPVKQRFKGIEEYAAHGWRLVHVESPNVGGTVLVWDTEP